ncbi:GAF domain-containing protein [Halalkalirubrum salinum]|uniref:GAF domain-containing protein n=1 Tax=Halalkalirubrum salinum TaxID=2563889 RepID=UPI0010FBA662|nr:GAF domain-containing protein [Halalkalirubrum salinum]
MNEPTSRGPQAVVSDERRVGTAEELLESVQRLTGVGAWAYDKATGEVWLSEQAKRIHGFDPDGQPTFERILDRYAEDDRHRVVELIDTVLQRAESGEIDIGLSWAGTLERTVRIRGEPRQRGANTEISGLYGTVRDVTEAHRREQRIEVLRQTSQQLRRAHSRQAVADVLADASKNILGLVNTTVRLIDDDNEVLQTVVATEECVERAGERPDYSVGEDSPAACVFRTGNPLLYADIAATTDGHDRGELVSGIYVPIGDHGVLSAGDVVIDAFDERDLEAACLLGELGAEALTRIDWAQRSRAV